MTDRELLKEARELIVAMVDWNKAMLKIVGHIPDTGFQSAEGLLSRIDEHLADHSPDTGNMVAAEIVRKIRNRSPQNICEKCGGTWEMHDAGRKCNGRLSSWRARYDYDLTDSESAAIIESYAAAEVIRLRKWQSEAMKLIDGCLAMPSELADRLIAEAQEGDNA